MSDLTKIEKHKLEKLFEMRDGYVLGGCFSNASLQGLVLDVCEKDVYDEAYSRHGTSKANRLRGFWDVEPNHVVGKLPLRHERDPVHSRDRVEGGQAHRSAGNARATGGRRRLAVLALDVGERDHDRGGGRRYDRRKVIPVTVMQWGHGFRRLATLVSGVVLAIGLVWSTAYDGSLAVTLALAALPWVLFWTVRWLARGFAPKPAATDAVEAMKLVDEVATRLSEGRITPEMAEEILASLAREQLLTGPEGPRRHPQGT